MAAHESSSRFLSRLGCLCSLLISRFFLYELKMFYYAFERDRFRLFFWWRPDLSAINPSLICLSVSEIGIGGNRGINGYTLHRHKCLKKRAKCSRLKFITPLFLPVTSTCLKLEFWHLRGKYETNIWKLCIAFNLYNYFFKRIILTIFKITREI